jgi:hypothetical protein
MSGEPGQSEYIRYGESGEKRESAGPCEEQTRREDEDGLGVEEESNARRDAAPECLLARGEQDGSEVRREKQHVGGERQHCGVRVERQKEGEQSRGPDAFAARPQGGGQEISEDAREQGVDRAGHAEDRPDFGAP